jgi:DNA (cytosine-5)-methyltransferase 1
MKHASLFSGIGGFDLAAQSVGFENVFHCEINPFCRTILKYYWPNAQTYQDIKTTDFTIWRGQIDILSGGFPCQDASIAGKQEGLQGKRTGLFYEMLRSVRETRPRYIVAENVANITKINNGNDFRAILNELARLGYNAEWRIIYASQVGAPHKRARLYLVAYPNSIRMQPGKTILSDVQEKITPFIWGAYGTSIQIVRGGAWNSEPPILCLDDGISRSMVRKALHGYGNAIVPQIAQRIFEVIKQSHEHTT